VGWCKEVVRCEEGGSLRCSVGRQDGTAVACGSLGNDVGGGGIRHWEEGGSAGMSCGVERTVHGCERPEESIVGGRLIEIRVAQKGGGWLGLEDSRGGRC